MQRAQSEIYCSAKIFDWLLPTLQLAGHAPRVRTPISRTAIVRAQHNQSVFANAELFEQIEHAAHGSIQHRDGVSLHTTQRETGHAHAAELRDVRVVRSEVDEEGHAACGRVADEACGGRVVLAVDLAHRVVLWVRAEHVVLDRDRKIARAVEDGAWPEAAAVRARRGRSRRADITHAFVLGHRSPEVEVEAVIRRVIPVP